MLWTNPSPTSSFAAQNVSVSSSGHTFSEFTYLRFEGRVSKSNSGTAKIMNMIPVSEFTTYLTSTSGYIPRLMLGALVSTNNWARMVAYVDNSTVKFWGAFNASTGSASNTDNCIPTKIIGLK